MMDRCTFIDFKTEIAIRCHYKAWKSEDIFKLNSDCIRLKEECHIHHNLRVSKSWANVNVWVNYTFKGILFVILLSYVDV